MLKTIPVGELDKAVQSAVDQVLKKHNFSIDKLWVGFVAPDAVATQELATELATKIGGHGAVGSVATTTLRPAAGVGGIQSDALIKATVVGMMLPVKNG